MASSLAFLTTALFTLLTAPTTAEPFVVQQHTWYKDYYPQPDAYCFNGCYDVVDLITFNYTPVSKNPTDWNLNRCSDILKSKSILLCAQKYCTPAQAHSGRDRIVRECEDVGVNFPSVEETTLSQLELEEILVLNSTAGLATAKQPLGPGILAIPDSNWHALGVKTVETFYSTWGMSFDFSFLLIGFWALVIAIGVGYRLLGRIRKPMNGPPRSWWLWIRRTLILPATFGHKQAEPFAHAFTIPPRIESILLGIYLIINIVMCFPGYSLFVGNLWYPEKKVQLARYIADRTGFLSVAQLPMVWIFAARNGPFLWVTGWSFATFNRFHRWIARTSVFHAVVHSITYSIWTCYTGTYKASWAAQYWWCGGIATVAMCVMLGASAYYFREKCYDLFLVVHILLSVIFFVTLWFHVRIFNGEFNYYLYPCIAMWVLDRVLRVGRMVSISVIPRFRKGVKATATYDPTTEMIRLDVTEFLPNQNIIPGLYYYLWIPSGLRGYESHPFTLCSWRRPGTSLPNSPTIAIKDEALEPLVRFSLSSNHFPYNHDSNSASETDIAHTLLIRPQTGMTRRLARNLLHSPASSSPHRQQTLSILLEGPYGTPLSLSHYSDILFICGGSGITSAVSHLHLLTSSSYHHRDKHDYGFSSPSSMRIHIIWSVPYRQRNLPVDLCANELASVMGDERVRMTVYLTTPSSSTSSSTPSSSSSTPYELHAHKTLTTPPTNENLLYEPRLGRPDIQALIRNHKRKARESLAVVTCGTAEMSDDFRAAVVGVLGEKEGAGVEVGWYNEALTW